MWPRRDWQHDIKTGRSYNFLTLQLQVVPSNSALRNRFSTTFRLRSICANLIRFLQTNWKPLPRSREAHADRWCLPGPTGRRLWTEMKAARVLALPETSLLARVACDMRTVVRMVLAKRAGPVGAEPQRNRLVCEVGASDCRDGPLHYVASHRDSEDRWCPRCMLTSDDLRRPTSC